MKAEPINISMKVRVHKDDLNEAIANLKSRKMKFFEIPPSLRRTEAAKWESGTTDQDWPQIHVEYMK
jgi:hypothetical protein